MNLLKGRLLLKSSHLARRAALAICIIAMVIAGVYYLPRPRSFWTSWPVQVQQGVIAACGSVFSAATAVFLAYILFQRHQLKESRDRAEMCLDITLRTRVLDFPGDADTRAVETSVEIKNRTNRSICIPAAYVSARSLLDDCDYVGDPSRRPLLSGSIGEVVNVARIPNSLLQLGPEETERLTKWDLIDRSIWTSVPIIVSRVDVFAAEVDILGQRQHPRVERAPLATEWITFMESQQGVRHTYPVFARSSVPDGSDRLKRFKRFLVRPGSPGTKDIFYSERFAKVLEQIASWNREWALTIAPTSPPSSGSLAEQNSFHRIIAAILFEAGCLAPRPPVFP